MRPVDNPAQHPFMRLPKFGDGTGLHRVRHLMEHLGIDMKGVSAKALVVTGSNGKGSTARIASGLLQALGLNTGLFTSPHLYRYNERFQINSMPVNNASLYAQMTDIMAAVAAYRQPDRIGAFEAQCALAIKWFSDCKVDCMVLEAGIGGRYDPVRAAKSRACALVSLDLEHTALLGNTLQEIALDKMDACAEGGTLVCGESCRGVRAAIESHARQNALSVQFLDDTNWKFLGMQGHSQRFDLQIDGVSLENLTSPLAGPHQLNNHAVAAALCHTWLTQQGTWDGALATRRWPQAIAQVNWPGRLEKISASPPVYIDVGHTPEGVAQALEGFRLLTAGQPALLVMGCSTNKKTDEIARILAPSFGTVICTAAYHKGSDAAMIAQHVAAANPQARIFIEPAIEGAVGRAIREAATQDLNVYVAGGLFLAAEFAHTLRGGNAKALNFF